MFDGESTGCCCLRGIIFFPCTITYYVLGAIHELSQNEEEEDNEIVVFLLSSVGGIVSGCAGMVAMFFEFNNCVENDSEIEINEEVMLNIQLLSILFILILSITGAFGAASKAKFKNDEAKKGYKCTCQIVSAFVVTLTTLFITLLLLYVEDEIRLVDDNSNISLSDKNECEGEIFGSLSPLALITFAIFGSYFCCCSV